MLQKSSLLKTGHQVLPQSPRSKLNVAKHCSALIRTQPQRPNHHRTKTHLPTILFNHPHRCHSNNSWSQANKHRTCPDLPCHNQRNCRNSRPSRNYLHLKESSTMTWTTRQLRQGEEGRPWAEEGRMRVGSTMKVIGDWEMVVAWILWIGRRLWGVILGWGRQWGLVPKLGNLSNSNHFTGNQQNNMASMPPCPHNYPKPNPCRTQHRCFHHNPSNNWRNCSRTNSNFRSNPLNLS